MKPVLAFLVVVGIGAAEPIEPSKGLVLANAHTRFEFEPGTMGLSAMVDVATGRNHIQAIGGKHTLWEVAFGRGTQVRRITNNYRPCNYASLEKASDGGQLAILEWRDLRWWSENRVVSVRVTINLPPDSGLAEWRVNVENRSDYWGLWTVSFPLVNGFPELGQYDIARPAFGSGGHLLRKWTERIEDRNPSGGWPMQFVSLSRDSSGVYLASMDSHARAKDFVIEPGRQIALVHYPENMGVAGSDFADPYPMTFGSHRGGWLEAAQYYRKWALAQKWAAAGPLAQRHDVPELASKLGAWIFDHWTWDGVEGSPAEMDRPLLEMQSRLGVPLGLHWHNWHQVPFDNRYPHFFPARPGFADRVADLARQGVLVMPYINGLSVDYDIPDFASYAPYAMRDEGGGFRMNNYGEHAGRLLSMCPTQEKWRDTVVGLVEKLTSENGVNGVYLDQISGMRQELCFHPDHNHPRGGGSHWVEGNRALLGRVREVARRGGRQCVIGSECAEEAFIDLVDLHLLWSEVTDWEIPLLQVVYSGYTQFFGSPWTNPSSPRGFNYAQGQAFINGRQPGWMRIAWLQRSGGLDYLRRCAQYRLAAAKYLVYGRLLAPVEPAKPVPTMVEEFGGRRFIGPKRRAEVPTAEARLWQAPDGRIAIVLANYVREPVSFSYRIDLRKLGLTGSTYAASELTPDGQRSLGRLAGELVERTEALPPEGLKVVEIANTAERRPFARGPLPVPHASSALR